MYAGGECGVGGECCNPGGGPAPSEADRDGADDGGKLDGRTDVGAGPVEREGAPQKP